MATGVIKRHSQGCRSRAGGRCSCQAGYEAWVYVRRNGQRVKVRKTFKREAEARGWRADAVAAAKRGALRPVRHDARTLVEALEQFVAGMDAGEIRPRRRLAYKPATVRSYGQHLRVRITGSHLGGLRVAEVTRADVQAWVDERLAAGDAPGTVANALCPIQAFYRRAVTQGALAANPATAVDVPAPVTPRKRIATGPEAAQLIAALPAADRPLWATAFYAGLRRGELQALRWRDVDLGSSTISIERSWDQYEGPGDPKTTTSSRTVPLLAALRDHLDEHRLRAAGDQDGLVFGRTATLPFTPPATDRRAQAAWAAAGLVPITLHECRHTFASLLIDAGANPKAVQEFMGHARIQTTFDTYGHLMPGSRDEVRERMDAYLALGAEAALA
jgi:integrase